LRDEDLITLLNHIDTINNTPLIRLVVLTSNTHGQHTPVFCSGYCVDDFDSAHHDPKLFEKVPNAFETLRPISVCALNGSVYGGATDLMLACDLRIGLAGSQFRMPANALGLHFYPNGLRRYVSGLGINLAKQLFLTARTLPIEALQTAHVFSQIVSSADFDMHLNALCAHVLALAPLSTQLSKQSLNELVHFGLDTATLARIQSREARCVSSQDFAEGRAAFADKRSPQFKGC
jgi:enoyl-CoA hydratase/carnithine racemase